MRVKHALKISHGVKVAGAALGLTGLVAGAGAGTAALIAPRGRKKQAAIYGSVGGLISGGVPGGAIVGAAAHIGKRRRRRTRR